MIIFDFDQTLVDTSSLAALRKERKWSEVNRRMEHLKPYHGVSELVGELRLCEQRLAIVTTSPSMVAEAFVKRNDWPIETVVGYHQMSRRKPDPQGLQIALDRCKADASTSFHVGDGPEDTEASRRGGLVAIGAGWGCEDVGLLEESAPDYLFMSVDELRLFLRDNIDGGTHGAGTAKGSG